MILYRINVVPPDSVGEGEDWDEWFGCLQAARKRRAEMIREDRKSLAAYRKWAKDPDRDFYAPARVPHNNYSIDQVTLPNLPPKQMLLAVLNRRFTEKVEQVVAEWKAPPARPPAKRLQHRE